MGRGCWRVDNVAWLDNMFERTPEEVGFFLEDLVMTWLAFLFLCFEAVDY